MRYTRSSTPWLAALSLLLGGAAGCNCNAKATDGGGGSSDAGPDAAASDSGGPFVPDRVCPGDPDCTGTGDDVLYAAAVTRVITPYFETWTDVDGNYEYDPAIDTFDDLNGDGVFQAV